MDYAYIVPYLQSKISNPILADSLKQEIERRFYHYGAHFKSPFESNTVNYKTQLILEFRELVLLFKSRLNSKRIPKNSIVSNAYVSAGHVIHSQQFNFIRPPWSLSLSEQVYADFDLVQSCIQIKKKLNSLNLNDLLSDEFLAVLEELILSLHDYFSNSNIIAGLFPYDIGFFECLSISLLKQMKKKSIIYIHGIPGVYEQELYTRGDHIFVFGHQIKENFKKIQFSQEKIHVVGYPQKYTHQSQLTNSFSNILVIGHSMPGSHFTSREPILYDRGNLIYYPYLIQEILQKFNIKKAIFRPHPSENSEWYEKHIDVNFYDLDKNKKINESLKNATLVIGPSSSVAIEAIASGVNYLCFEPFTRYNSQLAPPFNGSDNNLITCFNQKDLESALQNQKKSNVGIIKDYFDFDYRVDQTLKQILDLK